MWHAYCFNHIESSLLEYSFFLSSWYCPSALLEGIPGREAGKCGAFFVSLSVCFLQANSFWQEGSFLGELTLEPGAALTGTVGVPLPL